MKKYLRQLSFIVVVFLLVCTTSFSAITPSHLSEIKKSCQCPRCDLSQSNFDHYQPGSEDKKLNPLAIDLEKNHCQTTCNFNESNFSHSNLQNTNFTVCYKGYETPLKKVDFTRANLTYANLQYSIFIAVSFHEANLSHARASFADFTVSSFNGADLSGIDLQHTKMLGNLMSGQGTDMRNTNFSHANLTRAELYGMVAGANFSNATFNQTIISTSDEAYFPDNISVADLWKDTNFSNTDLRKVKLSDKNENGMPDLHKALFCNTIMPDGKKNNRDCKRP